MQLVYRAASYTFQPAAPALSLPTIAVLHTLLYRGKVYHHRKPTGQPAPISHTLNWRFKAVCNTQDAALHTAPA